MTKRMLIDAAHAEETRVVVVDGNRIEELDFESQARKQLRGNIYLAKVTRVEPSLQAAFVEYGGNRHGFLAFNEIHPDYYQIPVADREALMREEEDDEDEPPQLDEDGEEIVTTGEDDDDDVMEQELERRRRRLMRRYKIQEVIRRRQIMLIQVVKEERGNKGAALTTYLSLAGRYCVLMPNTARGGGISRKITNAADRKRLKAAAQDLELPQGMGLIIRTAGASRTRVEIRRDYEYLMRMWENIRETTLKSVAPSLIYAEEDLVKRAIRDMYDKDLDSIIVEGEAGYREAREFMRMIMPSQAKKIEFYREKTPLFVKHQIEDQLAQIHSPVVQLPSGGYLVINQTEALVAVDVNSGRATRERNIEATALKTNMEAAEEAARQLRLRDLAGLIVIDFIDMDEGKNNRAVEKKLKDCLSEDRARVQMGKISPFGLMEISRQRRRSGVLEGSTHICEHCQGTGRVRSIESSSLAALRAIEAEAARGAGAITVRLPTAVGLYVLNGKRIYLSRLEQMHDLDITIVTDDALTHAEIEVERTLTRESVEREPLDYAPMRALAPEIDDEIDDFEDEEDEVGDEEEDEALEADAETDTAVARSASRSAPASDRDGPSRRKRRRRGRRDEEAAERFARSPDSGVEDDDEDDRSEDEPAEAGETEMDGDRPRRRRRRGRRGGRRLREDVRPADPYVWVHAHGGHETPHESEDPYAWRDPHAANAAPEDRAIEARAEAVLNEPGPRRPEPVRSAPEGDADQADPYTWSDPAGADDTPRASRDDSRREGRRDRGRRGRGRRGRGAWEERGPVDEAPRADVSEFDRLDGEPLSPSPPPAVERRPAEDEVDEAWPTSPVAEVGAHDDRSSEVAAPVAEAPQEAESAPAAEHDHGPEAQPGEADADPMASGDAPTDSPLPVLTEPAAAEVEAPPPPAPDPNEITAPPEAPKRGWWRKRL